MAFAVRTRGSLRQIPQALRREIHVLNPSVPIYDLARMSETMAKARGRMTFLLSLLAIGSAATLALESWGCTESSRTSSVSEHARSGFALRSDPATRRE